MAKKAKKSAVKKTSSKSKTKVRGKTATKVKAKPAKLATSNRSTKASAKRKKSPDAKVGIASLHVAEYKLFTEDSVRGLEDQVNYHIQKGWSPVGGVVLHGSTFTQTMVRHEV